MYFECESSSSGQSVSSLVLILSLIVRSDVRAWYCCISQRPLVLFRYKPLQSLYLNRSLNLGYIANDKVISLPIVLRTTLSMRCVNSGYSGDHDAQHGFGIGGVLLLLQTIKPLCCFGRIATDARPYPRRIGELM